MSPALNGSSAIQCFEGSDTIEIRDGITFDFYMGLPHIYIAEPSHATGRNLQIYSVIYFHMKIF